VQHTQFGRGEGVDEQRAPNERDVHDPYDAQGGGPLVEENLRLRQELLVLRDDLIGHEARLGEALGRIELLEIELRRYKEVIADAERLLGSTTAEWRLAPAPGTLLRVSSLA
jgi:hypothetical protein